MCAHKKLYFHQCSTFKCCHSGYKKHYKLKIIETDESAFITNAAAIGKAVAVKHPQLWCCKREAVSVRQGQKQSHLHSLSEATINNSAALRNPMKAAWVMLAASTIDAAFDK